VCFGLGFTFFGEAATGKWYENSLAFQSINVLVGAAIWVVLQKHDKVTSIKKIARMKISYIGGSLGSIGAAGLFIALESIDEIAVPAAVAAAAPLVTAILAYIFDKEHLTVLQRFSTFIIVSGIVILAINS
jgi:drug/metabolite transporter (DMT)-like permease